MKFDILKSLKSLISSISGKKEQHYTTEKEKIHPVEKRKKGSIRGKREDSAEKKKRGTKFRELGLPSQVLNAIEKIGYEEMTPIQEATYSIITSGRDLCALAETGSGKTAACSIPLVQKIDTSQNAIQGLVIVPTRELCLQYVDEIEKIGVGAGVVSFAVFGGFSKEIQVAKIKHEVHILVATPGRLIDLLYDGVVSLSNVKCVVLDEADELLKEGFLEDIEFIMSCMINKHQTLLFAATMDDDITKLSHNYLRDPEYISLIEKRAAPVSIEHYFAYLQPYRKEAELIKYLEAEAVNQVIIFCNARHRVDKLFRDMRKHYKDIEYIHAGLSQNKRSSIFRQFKTKKLRYLIATDVAGRGLDFTHVSHIVNWDLPWDGAQYTHRTGRSGRMGKRGRAFTLVTKRDLPKLREIIRKKKIVPRWIGKDPLQETQSIPKENPKTKKRPYRRYKGEKEKMMNRK
ncbi:MAG: DEAD/DEAH box helicase [Thermodesulfobacteriota bacterium]|nr:DEAD/DEAH box helicase [Thermodesulfobacteriota bacterium]